MKLLNIICLALCICVFASIVNAGDKDTKDICVGITDTAQAYYMSGIPSKLSESFSDNWLFMDTFDNTKTQNKFHVGSHPVKYDNRWRISYENYWAIEVIDIVHGQRVFTIKRTPMSRFEEKRPEKSTSVFTKTTTSFSDIKPLETAFELVDAQKTVSVHYDILPTSADTVRLFILHDSTMHSWKYKGQQAQQSDRSQDKWEQEESYAVKFNEPFRVFSKGSTYFFVTDSGSVYAARKNGEGRDVQMLWDERNDPVQVVIQNINNGKTYAFTSGICFELDDVLKTKKYEKTKEMKEAKDKLEKVRMYGKICK